jgi:protein TonB
VAEALSVAPAIEPSTTALAAPRDREPGSSGSAIGAHGGGLAAGLSMTRGSGGSGSDAATGAGLHGGGGLALAIPGSGTQGGSGPAGDYAPYLAGLRRRIQEALRYPLPARRRGVTGTVHVEIVIGPDGKVAMAGVAESSSHRLLDEAALEAVRSVAPEPFPSGLPRRALRVRLPVVFDLQ